MKDSYAILQFWAIWPFATGLYQEMYQSELVHMDSVSGVSPSRTKASLQDCAQECTTSKDSCKGFFLSPDEFWECKHISGKTEGLVQTSQKSRRKVKVYLPEAGINLYKNYSHFFIMNHLGQFEDFSDDSLASPPIASYPTSHSGLSGGSAPICILERDRSLTCIEKNGGPRLFSWNFDDQPPQLLPITIRQHGLYPLTARQKGKMFVLGGVGGQSLIDIYEGGNITSISTQPPGGLSSGCAAFLPGDDNLVYFGGGNNLAFSGGRTSKFWTYNIAGDSFTPLPDIPHGVVATQACVGAVTKAGEKIFVVIGGRFTNSGPPDPRVSKYSPSTQSWSSMTPLPVANSQPSAAFWKGYIYVFGGVGASSQMSTVWRMLPEDFATWETVGSLSGATYYPIVVPYA